MSIETDPKQVLQLCLPSVCILLGDSQLCILPIVALSLTNICFFNTIHPIQIPSLLYGASSVRTPSRPA